MGLPTLGPDQLPFLGHLLLVAHHLCHLCEGQRWLAMGSWGALPVEAAGPGLRAWRGIRACKEAC